MMYISYVMYFKILFLKGKLFVIHQKSFFWRIIVFLNFCDIEMRVSFKLSNAENQILGDPKNFCVTSIGFHCQLRHYNASNR